MRKQEFDEVVDSMIRQVTAEIEASRDELLPAYETFMESGGLSVFMGAKIQKNGKASDQVLVLCNISFPKDKYKDSSKEVIHLGQTKLPLGDEDSPAAPEGDIDSALHPETESLDPHPTPDQEEDPPGVEVVVGKKIKITVGTVEDEGEFSWFSEIGLPPGLETYAGAYQSEEAFPSRDEAILGGLSHAATMLDIVIDKKVAAPSQKASVKKAKIGLESAMVEISGIEGSDEPENPAVVH